MDSLIPQSSQFWVCGICKQQLLQVAEEQHGGQATTPYWKTTYVSMKMPGHKYPQHDFNMIQHRKYQSSRRLSKSKQNRFLECPSNDSQYHFNMIHYRKYQSSRRFRNSKQNRFLQCPSNDSQYDFDMIHYPKYQSSRRSTKSKQNRFLECPSNEFRISSLKCL
jgi:hypothetical protein